MNKTTIEADKLFIKAFIYQRYQDTNLELGLIDYFEYYWGAFEDFLKNRKRLSNKIIDITIEEKEKIENYLMNNDNDESENTGIYYLMLQTAILILKRHYNEDGTIKTKYLI